MMMNYSITKYNPKYRDDNGCYNKEEWTSISDIGKEYDGKVFTLGEYIDVENVYIHSILQILEYFKLDSLFVMELEKYSKVLNISETNKKNSLYTPDIFEVFNKVEEGSELDNKMIENIIKLILRENLWCGLYSRKIHFIIKFGYDYYMNVICPILPLELIKSIENNGIFILSTSTAPSPSHDKLG